LFIDYFSDGLDPLMPTGQMIFGTLIGIIFVIFSFKLFYQTSKKILLNLFQ